MDGNGPHFNNIYFVIFALRINIFWFCQRIFYNFHNRHFHYPHPYTFYIDCHIIINYVFRFITIAFYEDEIRLFNHNLILPNWMNMNITRVYPYNIHCIIYLHVFYFTWCNIFYEFNTFWLELHSYYKKMHGLM